MAVRHAQGHKHAQRESLLLKTLSSFFFQISQDNEQLRGLYVTRLKLSPDGGICTLYIHAADGLKMFEDLIAQCGKKYAILGGVPCTMLEAAWYLRGLESYLMDLYSNRDFAVELLDRTMKYHLAISKKLVEMGVDIIWWGDDVANENGPF